VKIPQDILVFKNDEYGYICCKLKHNRAWPSPDKPGTKNGFG